jgi:tRNA threonylcarbamoyladenosine biosynthesis protein TsaB
MHILALDTSTEICSVAILKDNDVIIETSHKVKTGHSETVLIAVDNIIKEAGIKKTDIDLVATGLGPGSFTGLRIGIATAKGLAAAINCEIRGVGTLHAIAENVQDSVFPVLSVIDARKGEVFCALYSKDIKELMPPVNIEPHLLKDIIMQQTLFVGNAVEVYSDIFSKILKDLYIPGDKQLWYPRASVIGRLALNDNIAIKDITPVYVRASDATLLLEKLKARNAIF